MNSDDEKRLAEIRARSVEITDRYNPVDWSQSTIDRKWLLAKLDESERARKEAEEEFASTLYSAATDRANRAEAALAEERAKREALEASWREWGNAER